MTFNLAKYEYVPALPAAVNAIFLALVTGLLVSAVCFLIPITGWNMDQPVTVPVPVLLEMFENAVTYRSIEEIGFDIAQDVGFRAGGIVLAMLVAGLAGYEIAHSATVPVDRRSHYAGRQLVAGKRAKRAAARELLSKSGGEKHAPNLAPGLPWPRAWQVLNLLVLGSIGSGKTRILLGLLEGLLAQVWQKGKDCGLFIYDATGEILSGLPVDDSEIAVISSSDGSAYGWAMSRDIRSVSDCESVAAQRARTIKDVGLWEKGAATLDAGAMVLCGIEHQSWSAPELYEMSLTDPIQLKGMWEKHYPPAAKLIEIDPESGALSRTSASFLITWRANVLRTLRPLAEAWKNLPPERQFSFGDWLHGRGGQPKIVVLPRNGRHPDISAAWIAMALDAIAGHLGDPALPVSQTRLRTFVIDEAPTLGRLERWPEILNTGRNRGVSTIAVCQDLTQFRQAYGDVAKSILQRFRLKIIGEQTPGPDSIEIAEEWIGSRKIQDWSLARRRDGQIEPPQVEEVPIVPSEHLSDRLGVKNGSIHALLVGLKQIYQLEWPITVWARRR